MQEEIGSQLHGNWGDGPTISLEAGAAGLSFLADPDCRVRPGTSQAVACPCRSLRWPKTRKNRRKKKRETPQFDPRHLLYLMRGVDLARIVPRD